MLTSKNIQDIYPLSPMQEGMLFHHLYDAKSAAYFIQVSYGITGYMDIDCVKKSLQQLVARHDILRTVFNYKKVKDKLLQVVLKERDVDFYYEDLRSIAEDKDEWVRSFKNADARRSFDLTRDMLMRVSVLRLGDNTYEFIWSYHHILMDGWSMGILINEYYRIYNSYVRSIEPGLPPARQFKEYIGWLLKQDSEQGAMYWNNYLSGYEGPAEIPGRIVPGAEKTRGKLHFELDEDMVQALTGLALKYKVTLHTVMEVVWGVILARYNAGNDVVFGSVVSGRPAHLEGMEEIVGPFINTVPVRILFNSHTRFSDLLVQVQADSLQANDFHYYPLANIQADNGLRQHLVRHILVFENYPVAEDVQTAGEGDDAPFPQNVTDAVTLEHNNYDFAIVIGHDGNMRIRLEYAMHVHDTAFINTIPGHFRQLLAAILEDPEQYVSALSVITPAEKELIMEVFNNTDSPYPANAGIPELFEEQVMLNPEKVALICGNTRLTYRGLNEKSNRLARQLRIGKGELVALEMSRSEWLIIGILGILKAGGAYLALEPALPAPRKTYIYKEAGIKVILTEAVAEDICRTGETENLSLDIAADATCCVMYTSGSSGTPKGVVIAHRNIVSLAKCGQFPGTILLSTSSPSFDASLLEYWNTLLNGGQLIMMPERQLLNIPVLKEALLKHRVNIIWFTSGLFNQLVDTDFSIFGSLKTLIVGGEKLSPEHIHRFRAAWPHIHLINGYGPTENTTFSLLYPIKHTDGINDIPVGRPLKNRRAYILDGQLQLCPVGVTGQIFVAGAGVSKGYLAQPAMTGERFINGPDGTVIYNTGDLGRWNTDGDIIYLGRTDDQIKLRGYRIELNEISQVLSGYPDIISSVAVVGGQGTGRYIAAYYKSGNNPEPAAIRSYLSERLPEYMVPAYLMQVADFPLSANGKLDRASLPDPEQRAADMAAACDITVSETEQALIETWKEVLGRDNIVPTDNFFDLGGNSLDAIRVVSYISKRMNVQVEVVSIFEQPTVRELASLIRASDHSLFESIPQLPDQPYYELSYAQKRLWLSGLMENTRGTNNIFRAHLMIGNPDMTALEKAFETLIDRHEILRTVFIQKDGVPYQRICRRHEIGYRLSFRDLRLQKPDARELKEWAERTAGYDFDLAEGPLLRTEVIRISDDRFIFLLCMHHIITDEWSMEVLIRELMFFYTHFQRGAQLPELKQLKLHYKDFAAWQNNLLKGGNEETHRAYWMQQLSGELPVLDLPLDYPRPQIRGNRGSTVSIVMDKEIKTSLDHLCRSNEVSLFMCMMAVTKALLFRYTGQQDIIIGTPVAGRQHIELEEQIGFYVNTLAIRSFPCATRSFAEFLKCIGNTILEGFNHQHYPLNKLTEDLQVHTGTDRMPLFDVVVSYHNVNIKKEEKQELPGVAIDGFDIDITTSKYDLTFHYHEEENELILELEYNTDLFTRSRMLQLLRHCRNFAASVAADSSQSLGNISFMDNEEVEKLVTGLNNTAAYYPADKTVIDIFEEQASLTPEAVALVYDDIKLTYREVNEQANRLAAYLRDQYQLKPGDLAGVFMERSSWVIIGLLGILKSGAAYVPVDVETPTERALYIFRNAGIKVLLTDLPNMFSETGINCGAQLCVPELLTEKLKSLPSANITGIGHPSDIAYVIYTSGSTGEPKGCVIGHQGIVNMALSQIAAFGVNSYDKCLQFASLSFDASVYEIFIALFSGATLVLLKKGLAITREEFSAFIRSTGITMAVLPPSYLSVLEQEDLEGLRLLVSAGEPAIVAGLSALSRNISCYNAYGPAECTVCVTLYAVSPEDRHRARIPVGRPVSNTCIYILDQMQQLLPAGINGEICVGGPGLARGYLNNEELTNRKFIPHPFIPGERLYRTGDMGRWLEDGTLEFTGRCDRQVKLRGYRIEPGEIEHYMHAIEQVEAAVVIARNEGAEKYLTAYYTAKQPVDEAVIRNCLRARLPAYMIPAYIIQMPAFPLTVNGKIDRNKLPDPVNIGAVTEVYEAPSSEIETIMVAIWEEVTGRKNIGVNDNFFSLGGDSIRAVQIITRVSSWLHLTYTVNDLFTRQTIRGLAEIAGQRGEGGIPDIVPARPQAHYSLSHAQKRIWVVDQFENGQSAYNIPLKVEVDFAPDPSALISALTCMIERHESLRTNFITVAGEPRQKIRAMKDVDLLLVEKDFSKETDVDNAVTAFLNREISRPFRLAEDLLLRCYLLKIDDQLFVILLVLHHIIIDGWSKKIFFKELLQLYRGNRALPPLRLQYKDFSEWQHRRLSGAFKMHKQYWMNEFTGEIPVLLLPLDFNRREVRRFRGRHVLLHIHHEQAMKLDLLIREYECTPFIFLVALVNLLLYCHTGQYDIVTGMPVNARNHPDLENQIGLYLNLMPLRCRFDPLGTFASLVGVVREKLLEAYQHDIYPFDLLVEDLHLRQQVNRSPLFDVLVQMQEDDQPDDEPLELPAAERTDVSFNTSKFDLTFSMRYVSGQMDIVTEYDSDLFEAATINTMLEHMHNLIRILSDSWVTTLPELRRRVRKVPRYNEDFIRENLNEDF